MSEDFKRETNRMEVYSTNQQSSTWGAAFNKPLILLTPQEGAALLERKMQQKSMGNMTLQENNSTLATNNSYRNQNTIYEVSGKDNSSTFLDFRFLMRDETSCLKGSLSDAGDVDFYNFSIPYNRTLQNQFAIEIKMEMPEESNYRMTLYDEYGNQVGEAQWEGKNYKTLTIPNWDTQTDKYSIKIENEDGEEISSEGYYKISCRITENKEKEKTDAVHQAYCEWELHKNDENWQEYRDRYNSLLKEQETAYAKEVEQLHQKQYENLPADKQYKGSASVDELLQDMADGKELSDSELEYIKIFANLKDYEKAKKKVELKEFSEKFSKELENNGISKEELDEIHIKIESNGKLTVSGISDKNVQKRVEELAGKHQEELYQFYIGIADSIENLSSDVYEYAAQIQEVNRYLSAASGGNIALEDLYLRADGRVGGLPEKVEKLLYETKNNIKPEDIRDMLTDIVQNISKSGNVGIPEFSSEFQFQNGTLSVVDGGFSVDMDMLSDHMTYKTADKYDYYKYRFDRVL